MIQFFFLTSAVETIDFLLRKVTDSGQFGYMLNADSTEFETTANKLEAKVNAISSSYILLPRLKLSYVIVYNFIETSHFKKALMLHCPHGPGLSTWNMKCITLRKIFLV